MADIPSSIPQAAPERGTSRVKRGMAEMLKGGVIMDVVTADQAKIAEDAGAVAVMALERVPADIRAQGGVSRMSDPDMIDGIIEAVSIPVMAKARIGHFAEAQVLQSLGVDYIDESEVLTPADYANHIDKWAFNVPFVCGATNLGEALRRLTEGAAMIRSKGEAGTGDVSNAVTHMRTIRAEIRRLGALSSDELFVAAKDLQAPYDLVREVAESGKLPVVLFTAGGIATPADAAMMMQLGAEGVFVGSGIFKSGNPRERAEAIVKATTFYDDPDVVAKVSRGLGEAMVGINVEELPAAAPARRSRLVVPPDIGLLPELSVKPDKSDGFPRRWFLHRYARSKPQTGGVPPRGRHPAGTWPLALPLPGARSPDHRRSRAPGRRARAPQGAGHTRLRHPGRTPTGRAGQL